MGRKGAAELGIKLSVNLSKELETARAALADRPRLFTDHPPRSIRADSAAMKLLLTYDNVQPEHVHESFSPR
jgi:hypothetical protein